MKKIRFKPFEKFKDMKIKPEPNTEILYYSRLFGNHDWGFCISGFFDRDLEKTGENADYIQVQFFTHDVLFAGMTLVANPETKVMILKDITEENYNKCCEWIEKQRATLMDSIIELKGEINPLVDLAIQEEILEQKVISND